MQKDKFNPGKKGQAVVETALILPIIVLILMGIIDFGLLFNNYIVITNASREGARSAAIGKTDSNIVSSVINATTTLEQSQIRVTIYPAESVRKKGDEVTVTVQYDNSLLTPVISAIVPNPVRLTSRTVMRVE
ncbi:MAG: pilus assembly protein [Clostridia bacterium]|nr:pilus assembly protein [Clostridia bacterium]